MDLNKISVFSQIVESGNYRLASEVLHVSPSALSQTISGLEHSLGIPLFDRVGKKLVPTSMGLKIHQEFRRHHSEFLKAVKDLAAEEEKVSGVLRVGAYLEFAKSQLAPIAKIFLATYPEAQLKFVFDSPTRLHKLLEKDQLDLCFSIYPSIESRTIESTPAFHEELVMIAPPQLLSERPSFEQVMGTPIIEYYSNHQPIKKWLQLHFNKRPKNLPIRAYASSAEMVMALVEEGAGVGIVPQFVLEARKNLSAPIRVIRPTPKRLMDHIWLLEKKSAVHPASQKTFKKLLDSQKHLDNVLTYQALARSKITV